MEKNVSSVAEQDKTAEVKKNPKLIEAKRRREFRNRSRGQKMRWAVVRHNDQVQPRREAASA